MVTTATEPVPASRSTAPPVNRAVQTWIKDAGTPAGASVRVLCVPHAGCGPGPYLRWQQLLPAEVALSVVNLPGREGRFGEPPLTSMTSLLDQLTPAAAAWRDSAAVPYVVFGHSLGALIAFELAHRLAGPGGGPAGLVVSGHGAPHLPPHSDLHRLPDSEFLDQVIKDSGQFAGPLADPALRDVYLPVLRADFELTETYRCAIDRPLSCPIVTWSGASDRQVPFDEVKQWAGYTTAPTRYHVFPGDHFFAMTDPVTVLASLVAELRSITTR